MGKKRLTYRGAVYLTFAAALSLFVTKGITQQCWFIDLKVPLTQIFRAVKNVSDAPSDPLRKTRILQPQINEAFFTLVCCYEPF